MIVQLQTETHLNVLQLVCSERYRWRVEEAGRAGLLSPPARQQGVSLVRAVRVEKVLVDCKGRGREWEGVGGSGRGWEGRVGVRGSGRGWEGGEGGGGVGGGGRGLWEGVGGGVGVRGSGRGWEGGSERGWEGLWKGVGGGEREGVGGSGMG